MIKPLLNLFFMCMEKKQEFYGQLYGLGWGRNQMDPPAPSHFRQDPFHMVCGTVLSHFRQCRPPGGTSAATVTSVRRRRLQPREARGPWRAPSRARARAPTPPPNFTISSKVPDIEKGGVRFSTDG